MSTTRSAEWIKTCYSNTNLPFTFYGVGAEQSGQEQPVPELPTILLFSIGLLALFGYVVLRKRRYDAGYKMQVG